MYSFVRNERHTEEGKEGSRLSVSLLVYDYLLLRLVNGKQHTTFDEGLKFLPVNLRNQHIYYYHTPNGLIPCILYYTALLTYTHSDFVPFRIHTCTQWYFRHKLYLSSACSFFDGLRSHSWYII